MIKKIKQNIIKLNTAVLNFMTRNIAKIVGIVAAVAVLTFGLTIKQVVYPSTAAEFAETSVIITNPTMTTGGSGVILVSGNNETKILTNKHVCVLVQRGGFVIQNGQKYAIKYIKIYTRHDLCLVRIFHNLDINTKVASFPPRLFTEAYVSGHPALLPPVLTKGHYSGRQIIQVVVGFKPCTEKTLEKYFMYCLFFGGVPVTKSFESQLVTATILPGSSGSGVFTMNGEIGGIVFASRATSLDYAFIVPYEYVADFLKNEDTFDWIEVKPTNKQQDFFSSFFKMQDACKRRLPQLDTFCETVRIQSIWQL